MRIIYILFSYLILSVSQPAIAQTAGRPAIEMQNMHLTFDMYLSENPKNRGISAASWLRFRNNTGAPIQSLTLLLNPGLKVTKIVGAKNQSLRFKERQGSIGANAPRLKIFQVTLVTALKSGDSAEFSVQYQGDIQSLAGTNDIWPLDTLNPELTMIRPESFIYPVVSEPTEAAFESYRSQQRYSPTARITVPQGYSLAGSAAEMSRTLKGTREEIEVRTIGKAYGLTLGLARYSKIVHGPFKLFYLANNAAKAQDFALKVDAMVKKLTQKLGNVDANKSYIVADLTSAYNAADGLYHSFVNFADYDRVPIAKALPTLWTVKNYSGDSGGWHTALTKIAADTHETTETFERLKSFLSSNKKNQKLALKKYTEAGHADASTDGYALIFSALKELLGEEKLWNLLRSFRTEFVDFGASDEDLLDHLKNNIKNRKARKLVIDWIDKGRIMRDLDASDTFQTLVTRYQ